MIEVVTLVLGVFVGLLVSVLAIINRVSEIINVVCNAGEGLG